MKKQWYEKLFENYSEQYEKEIFVQGTTGECDFIEQEINHDRSVRILDIGCGTGRHAIELAQRGYDIVGIDLSEAQLNKARHKADRLCLQIDFQKHDARSLPFEKEFGLVIMICEGAFPLMETDEMNFQILMNAAKALKPGGKMIFTTLNGLFPIYNSIDEFHQEGFTDNQGVATYKSESFDLMTFRDFNETEFTDDDGVVHKLACNERYYIPIEITWLLKSLGFMQVEIFGAKLGAFSRSDQLTVHDFEMLVVAVMQDAAGN
jgi:2-polyprenyl-3-methyl-5-hydroxy-6-metoxy-1,4-benzoquinol methylase